MGPLNLNLFKGTRVRVRFEDLVGQKKLLPLRTRRQKGTNSVHHCVVANPQGKNGASELGDSLALAIHRQRQPQTQLPTIMSRAMNANERRISCVPSMRLLA